MPFYAPTLENIHTEIGFPCSDTYSYKRQWRLLALEICSLVIAGSDLEQPFNQIKPTVKNYLTNVDSFEIHGDFEQDDIAQERAAGAHLRKEIHDMRYIFLDKQSVLRGRGLENSQEFIAAKIGEWAVFLSPDKNYDDYNAADNTVNLYLDYTKSDDRSTAETALATMRELLIDIIEKDALRELYGEKMARIKTLKTSFQKSQGW